METAVLIAIALAAIALALAGYCFFKLRRGSKMDALDLEEFDALDPSIKSLLRENFTDKAFPAVMRGINKVWLTAIPAEARAGMASSLKNYVDENVKKIDEWPADPFSIMMLVAKIMERIDKAKGANAATKAATMAAIKVTKAVAKAAATRMPPRADKLRNL